MIMCCGWEIVLHFAFSPNLSFSLNWLQVFLLFFGLKWENREWSTIMEAYSFETRK